MEAWPDLLQYYMGAGGAAETPKMYYVINEQPLMAKGTNERIKTFYDTLPLMKSFHKINNFNGDENNGGFN